MLVLFTINRFGHRVCVSDPDEFIIELARGVAVCLVSLKCGRNQSTPRHWHSLFLFSLPSDCLLLFLFRFIQGSTGRSSSSCSRSSQKIQCTSSKKSRKIGKKAKMVTEKDSDLLSSFIKFRCCITMLRNMSCSINSSFISTQQLLVLNTVEKKHHHKIV